MTWVDDLVRPFIPVAYRPETYLPVKIPGFGLIIAFVALTLLGFLTANLVGRKLVEIGETSSSACRSCGRSIAASSRCSRRCSRNPARSFRTVGLVEFPAPGMWSLVFLSTPPGRRHHRPCCPSQEEHVSAFMPCTPNPTTGFFFYVPRREVIELDIPVEDAAKLIMTAGMIQPGGTDQNRLAALAETARVAKTIHTVAPAD